jgi:hypothetical protein
MLQAPSVCGERVAVFRDHFSQQAAAYAIHRPGYPAALFQYLASVCPRQERAWDTATGNGQAATGLARHFANVIATDASRNQVANAKPHPGVRYMVAASEHSPLAPASIDLTTIAAALHWLDLDAFYREVTRVSRPAALLAAWTYDPPSIDPAIDEVVRDFSTNTLASYWPPERRYVDRHYQTIPFPFERLPVPSFEARAEWDLNQLLNYVGTWSAVVRGRAATGTDLVAGLEQQLLPLWEPAAHIRVIRWQLFLLVGRVDGGSLR